MAHLLLADAMDPSETLFEAIGVPRQIVVDHQMASLEVDSLAHGVVPDQHQHLGIVHEPVNEFLTVFTSDASVNYVYGIIGAEFVANFVKEIL